MSEIQNPNVLGLRRTWRYAGTPTDGAAGTLYDRADPGDLLIDTTSKKLYQNINTKASPTWSELVPSEKSFTSWAIEAIYDTGVALSGSDIIAVRNDGNVFWHDQGAYTAYVISSAGVLLFTSESHMGISGFSRLASLLDKYMVLPKWNDGDTAVTKLAVQEGITELWEREVETDKGAYTLAGAPGPVDVSLIAISPNGEWIVAIIEEDGGNGLIFIYKGS